MTNSGNSKPLPDRATGAVEDAKGEPQEAARHRAGPVTGLVVSDILLRSGAQLSRHAMKRALLDRRGNPESAGDAVEDRSLLYSFAAFGVARLATRSVPAALLAGTGLMFKVLLDRSNARREAGETAPKRRRKRARRKAKS